MAKEAHDPHAGHNHGPGEGHDHAPPARPRLEWKVPEGWEESQPGEMRVASLRINENGKVADLGVFPLPGLAGGELGNVNRWRGQVGLEPVSQEELAKLAEPVQISGMEAKLFDMAGENASSGEATRILAAILNRENVAWFFKLTGDDALVARNKDKFKEFVHSFQILPPASELPPDHPPVDGMRPVAQQSSSGAGSTPQWDVPSGWQSVPGGQFLAAKFNIPGENGPAASVNVSTSAGDGGGVIANVNRWRKQLGLQELSESEIQKQLRTEDLPTGKATLVELSGKDARTGNASTVVGAIIPQPGQTWFYKLTGDEQTVAREKNAFLQLIRSARYPHGS